MLATYPGYQIDVRHTDKAGREKQSMGCPKYEEFKKLWRDYHCSVGNGKQLFRYNFPNEVENAALRSGTENLYKFLKEAEGAERIAYCPVNIYSPHLNKIQSAKKKLKRYKAPRPNVIPEEFFIEGEYVLVEKLHSIIVKCWEMNNSPKSDVTP